MRDDRTPLVAILLLLLFLLWACLSRQEAATLDYPCGSYDRPVESWVSPGEVTVYDRPAE